MSAKIEVLQTKITPPNVKDTILRRPVLMKKMKTIPFYPLTILHSGAGYGKTTALASYIHDQKSFSCWYSVGINDDDIIPFLTYMVYAIRKNFQGFGTELLLYVENIERYVRDEEIRTLCSLFINEITILGRNVMLVIDDYHLIQHSSAIDQWMTWLIQHLPQNLNLVISGRLKPNWGFLTSMNLKGELQEIKQSDLMFSFDEVEVLLSDLYEGDMAEKDIERIYSLTEGWIIAIGMIRQQLSSDSGIESILNNKSKSLDELFRFLAMEVFMKQPPMIQQFLENTCIFEELNGKVCDEVLGIRGSSEMLKELSEHNLFLLSIGEGQYRYHALFKEFLEQRLFSINERHFYNLHIQTARFYQRIGDFNQAIYHLEATEDFERIAEILHHYGEKMIQNGQLVGVLERIKNIPEALMDHYYLLWLYKGEALRYRCSYKEAEDCYIKTIDLAKSARDLQGLSRAYEGQARIYLDTIQPGKAERYLLQAIEALEENVASSSEDKSRVYQLMAENLANAGQANKAQKWYERGKDLNIPLLDGNLESRLYLRTGKLVEAKRILSQKKVTEQNQKTIHLQQSHRETDLLLSLIESFMGNGQAAKELAEAGIKQGVQFQAPFVEACGWIRMGHAVQLLEKYDTSLATQCYETALEIMDEINVSRGKAEPLMGLCLLYGNKGLYDRAIEFGNKALDETEKVKDAWLSAMILLCMGMSAVHNERYNEANMYLKRCEALYTNCGDQYGIVLTQLWLSFLYYYEKNHDAFIESITIFLKKMQVGGYDFILTKRTAFGPLDLYNVVPLLLEAQKEGIHLPYVNQLLNALGYSNITSHPGYTLRIKSLGGFQVWLGNQEIEESDWQRGKAKELLELFVTMRNTMVAREEIFACLWPEHSELAAARDFKVALNALNNVLEPNRVARSTPFFIKRIGSSYGLNKQAGYQLDIIEFEEWIHAGLHEKSTEQIIKFLKQALAFYEGDYLPNRKYEDWCLSERERLQVLFLRGAERIAQAFVQTEEFDEAIFWCEQILTKDRTWEEAYRLLMFCYYHKNNRPQAIKWYKKCVSALEDELGVTPMQPTKQVYEMVLQSSK
ncbi:BTAD domain-containing putative transcriptional regulator [Bacillus sinesaloumensis]|uniref:BTAD domain-containing putative transcriptional regulator n=1 Tax=Litchfieldia sinesaloumensis TaxID=1926280 RepID=UPI0009885267|nr:BTAD domain-containing putative transcriptional regulator [Bacillus sinesaloumensis]